jgi:hypothetical protein
MENIADPGGPARRIGAAIGGYAFSCAAAVIGLCF